MVIAQAEPLLQLPDIFKASEGKHIANLFSNNDIPRIQAVKWLSQHADPQTLSKIGKEVLKHDTLPVKVRKDIHKLLMYSSFRNLGGMSKLSNDHSLAVRLALCRTLVKARRH
jgi:hypothetical protein